MTGNILKIKGDGLYLVDLFIFIVGGPFSRTAPQADRCISIFIAAVLYHATAVALEKQQEGANPNKQ